MPAGNLKILSLKDGAPDSAGMKTVDNDRHRRSGAGGSRTRIRLPFNEAGEIALTLQENNRIAIIDAASARSSSISPAGSVELDKVDTKKDGALSFDGKVKATPREPDAVKWLDDNRFVVANEGDYKGGTRGFTIFNKGGEVVYEAGPSFEYEVAKVGHYPEHRNKKGNEPEGLEAATFGDEKLFFVASERGSLVGVYKDTGACASSSCRCCRRASGRKAWSPSCRATCWSPPTRPTSARTDWPARMS